MADGHQVTEAEEEIDVVCTYVRTYVHSRREKEKEVLL